MTKQPFGKILLFCASGIAKTEKQKKKKKKKKSKKKQSPLFTQ
jgi:hypothetical protein